MPRYAFNDLAKLADLCLKTPNAAGPFFYLTAAQVRKIEPDIKDSKRFRWHHGHFGEGREYFALEYPTPPPVDLSGASIEQMVGDGAPPVLAPHFPVIIRGAGDVQYFILGQAPTGSGTTLRCILPEGTNCNLGPGPEPKLAAFLDAVRGRATKRAEAGRPPGSEEMEASEHSPPRSKNECSTTGPCIIPVEGTSMARV